MNWRNSELLPLPLLLLQQVELPRAGDQQELPQLSPGPCSALITRRHLELADAALDERLRQLWATGTKQTQRAGRDS